MLKKILFLSLQLFLSATVQKFYNNNLQWVYEPGDYTVFVSGNSADTKAASFAGEK